MKRTLRRRWLAAGAAAASAVVLAGCTSGPGGGSNAGDEACENYPEQPVEFIVPYSAGGGFDTWARVVAPGLQQHLPNGVAVPVVNREGGAGLIGVTEVFTGPANGERMVIFDPAELAIATITGTSDQAFDELEIVTRFTVAPEVIGISAESEWNSIEDLQNAGRPLLMAAAGLAPSNIISFDALDIPYEVVLHEGSSEAILSVARGDTDVVVYPLSSMAESIRAGEIKPVLIAGNTPSADDPNADVVAGVPTLDEAAGAEGLNDSVQQHRVVGVAPGTPSCMVDILSDAFGEAFNDAALLEPLETARLVPAYLPASEAQAVVDGLFVTLDDYKDLLLEAMSE